jgi:hypothetical protein
MPSSRFFGLLAVVVLTTFAACRDAKDPEAAPGASAAPSSAPGSPQLMTSRDGTSAPPETTAAATQARPENSLPPGHPPIDGPGTGGSASGSPHGNPHGDPHGGAMGSGASAGPADPNARVTGTVNAAAGVKNRIQGGAIFVIARTAGSRQIVAVRRVDQSELPAPFELTSADVMMAGSPFAGPFDLTARWSKTGDAMPGSGDIEGFAKNVAVGAGKVKITLSEVRP